MRVVLLSPYHGGSHQAWAEGWARRSRHRIRILSLPARFWKWRLQGGALRLAERYLELEERPDLLLTTDMLDLTTFLAATRHESAGLPVVYYAHENQWTYPLPVDPTTGPMRRQHGERDRHYAWINISSMLVADRVVFNSEFHRAELLARLPAFFHHYPDERDPEWPARIAARSSVLPLGIDLARLDADSGSGTGESTGAVGAASDGTGAVGAASDDGDPVGAAFDGADPVGAAFDGADPVGAAFDGAASDGAAPLVLWNHRWEYDKDPETFFAVLDAAREAGAEFRLAVTGVNARQRPAEFEAARGRFGDRIVHWGYAPEPVYRRLLRAADLVVSTARHEFFGISVCEAMYCETMALLPRRLAYPELVPEALRPAVLYDGPGDLVARLVDFLRAPERWRPTASALRVAVARHDWGRRASEYDDRVEVWVREAARPGTRAGAGGSPAGGRSSTWKP